MASATGAAAGVAAGVAVVGLVAAIGYTLYVAYPGHTPVRALGHDPAGGGTAALKSGSGTASTVDNTATPDKDQPSTSSALSGSAAGNSTADNTASSKADLGKSHPAFDIVRIPAEGFATVAGTAEPNAKVEILVDGQDVAETTANGRGEFVALFDLATSDAPREMRLRSGSDDGVFESDESVIISPIIDPASQAHATLRSNDVDKSLSEDGASQKTANATAAPTVLMADGTGVKVVQQAGNVAGDLRVDSVSYDPEGRVYVSGRGGAGKTVRLYIETVLWAETKVGPDGQWRQELIDVGPGRYALRADQVDADGNVSQRAEIPFHREDVAVLAQITAANAASDAQGSDVGAMPGSTDQAAVGSAPAKRITSITVQPGNTLWGIATSNYGDGVLYARVFDANRAQIRDPDLIYPGQIFFLPDTRPDSQPDNQPDN